MVLDVSVNDSFLDLLHTKACLCRHIQVVADGTTSRQIANDFVVSFANRWLDAVLLREDVANKRRYVLLITSIGVVHTNLSEDELSSLVNLG